MKVFCISLKRRKERRRCFSQTTQVACEDIGYDVEIVDAVDGTRLNTSKGIQGRLGCVLSHIAVYRKIVEQSLPHALILEDDAFPVASAKDISRVLENRPSDGDVFYIGESVCSPIAARRSGNWKVIDAATNTHAMVVTQEFCQQFLKYAGSKSIEKLPPHNCHHDWILSSFYRTNPGLKVFIHETPLFVQNKFLDTDINWISSLNLQTDFTRAESCFSRHPGWEYLSRRGNLGEAMMGHCEASWLKQQGLSLGKASQESKAPVAVGGTVLLDSDSIIIAWLDGLKFKDREIVVLPSVVRNREIANRLLAYTNLTVLSSDTPTIELLTEVGVQAFHCSDLVFATNAVGSIRLNPRATQSSTVTLSLANDSSSHPDFEKLSPVQYYRRYMDEVNLLTTPRFIRPFIKYGWTPLSASIGSRILLRRIASRGVIATDQLALIYACLLRGRECVSIINKQAINNSILRECKALPSNSVRVLGFPDTFERPGLFTAFL
ncbi:glycosyltransferase family 25 protein [Rhodopirellula sp. JC740]|uniref:Glycosyltransferase family 25 protein n=1 Tax=Rhodopirellula halodulae TaxID=2894198 RepID=A0ABS8NE17_9BACT|nr:glycosyltransferase family 25 protein [Rhodopirellula sp. JC740]MCC9641664.1 glycosyltransferase family 25 protein [Rhodopirellula sp. JC740]